MAHPQVFNSWLNQDFFIPFSKRLQRCKIKVLNISFLKMFLLLSTVLLCLHLIFRRILVYLSWDSPPQHTALHTSLSQAAVQALPHDASVSERKEKKKKKQRRIHILS